MKIVLNMSKIVWIGKIKFWICFKHVQNCLEHVENSLNRQNSEFRLNMLEIVLHMSKIVWIINEKNYNKVDNVKNWKFTLFSCQVAIENLK